MAITAIGNLGAAADAGNSTTLSITVSQNVPAGSLIVVIGSARATTVTASDSKGNVYAVDKTSGSFATDGGLSCQICSCIVDSGKDLVSGTDTITVTYGALSRGAMTAFAFGNPGVLGVSPIIDLSAVGADQGFGTTADAGTAASPTAQADEVIVAGFGIDAQETLTPAAGYSNITGASNTSTRGVGGEYKITIATETPHPTGTWSGNTDSKGCFVVYKGVVDQQYGLTVSKFRPFRMPLGV